MMCYYVSYITMKYMNVRNDIGYNKYKINVVKDVIYLQAKVRKRSYRRKSREKIMFLTKLATSSK